MTESKGNGKRRCTSDGMIDIVAIVLNLDYKRLSVMCKKSIIPKMCNAWKTSDGADDHEILAV